MILAVTIAFLMGILITLVIFASLVVDVEVVKEPPDPYADILKLVEKKIIEYREAIMSETDEKVRLMLITKQDAIADLYQDIELFILTKGQKK